MHHAGAYHRRRTRGRDHDNRFQQRGQRLERAQRHRRRDHNRAHRGQRRGIHAHRVQRLRDHFPQQHQRRLSGRLHGLGRGDHLDRCAGRVPQLLRAGCLPPMARRAARLRHRAERLPVDERLVPLRQHLAGQQQRLDDLLGYLRSQQHRASHGLGRVRR